jgi:hypothetical protein
MGTATKQDCGKLHQIPPDHDTTMTVVYLDTLSLIWDYHTAIKILQQNEMLTDRIYLYITDFEKFYIKL